MWLLSPGCIFYRTILPGRILAPWGTKHNNGTDEYRDYGDEPAR